VSWSGISPNVQQHVVIAENHVLFAKPISYKSIFSPDTTDTRDNNLKVWVWAPEPPNEDYVAVGVVFTSTSSPPPTKDTEIRCVHKVMTTPSSTKMVECLADLKIAQNLMMSTFQSKDSPSLAVLGDDIEPIPEVSWTQLLPALSLSQNEGLEINVGGSPFKHKPLDYTSVLEAGMDNGSGDLQIFSNKNQVWETVQDRHNFFEEINWPHKLVGRWMMNEGMGSTIHNAVRLMKSTELSPEHYEKYEFPSGSMIGLSWNNSVLNPSTDFSEVWGYKLTVVPKFPLSLETIPSLHERFLDYANLLQTQDNHFDEDLVRYINTVSRRKGLEKKRVLDMKWHEIAPSQSELVAWPLLSQALSSCATEPNTPRIPEYGEEEKKGEGALLLQYAVASRSSARPDALDPSDALNGRVQVFSEPDSKSPILLKVEPGFLLKTDSMVQCDEWVAVSCGNVSGWVQVPPGSSRSESFSDGQQNIQSNEVLRPTKVEAVSLDSFQWLVKDNPMSPDSIPLLETDDEVALQSGAVLLSVEDSFDYSNPQCKDALTITGTIRLGKQTSMVGIILRCNGHRWSCYTSIRSDGESVFVPSDGLLCSVRGIDGSLRILELPFEPGTEPLVHDDAEAYFEGDSLSVGTELAFMVFDDGEHVVFSVSEIGGALRTATVKALSRSHWGSWRVGFAHFSEDPKCDSRGWLRIASTEKRGATVRDGVDIDRSTNLGRLDNGDLVYFDDTTIFDSGADVSDAEPVLRYHVTARKVGLKGWISQKGRFRKHPYQITERVISSPEDPPPALCSLSIGKIQGFDKTLVATQKDAAARVASRMSLVQDFNKLMEKTIPLVDLSLAGRPWSLATLVASCRSLIFSTLKQELWELALEESVSGDHSFELRLSRSRAARHKETCDNEAHYSLFSQAFRAMRSLPAEAYRLKPGDSLYSTIFMGEMSHDAGGPYRESFAQYTTELQSPALPLFLRCPNGVNNVGINREKWIPNPAATSPLHFEMYSFLGKIMGSAIRSQHFLDLNLPSIVWKQLVQQTLGKEDLEGIDHSQMQSLKAIRCIDEQGVTEELFPDVFDFDFSITGLDGSVVQLKPNGLQDKVTFANRHEYADLVEEYRMQEFSKQVKAIRSGLAQVVPSRLLTLFTWDELEVFVCGHPEVDIDLLKSCTDYNRCNPKDRHVEMFWNVLESFSSEERSLFLRFTWGRSRLPISADQFHQRFKIQSFSRSPADSYLPVAHTCFFSLELPEYSTKDIMASKLRYAIYNCQAIDADDTSVGRNAANMGWDFET